MRIRRSTVGVAGAAGVAGHTVHEYTLDTGAGPRVVVWTYGATLVEMLVPDRRGHLDNVVLRLPDLDSYRDRARNPYVGAVLGRYCRAVTQGRFTLDGVEHKLDRNDGPHHLHGGLMGFDRYVWRADAGRDGDALAVTLRHHSPDGDQGYPGALDAEVTYRVTADGVLTFHGRATTTRPTIVGLTCHAFWNLAGAGIIDDHHLGIGADRHVAIDDELHPVPGPPAHVEGGPLDFRQPRPIGPQALDNFFAVDAAPAVELRHPVSGRVMSIVTDQPGLGVYSGDGLPRPRTGLCLQPSPWPDAPNRPDFPPVRLDPGDEYRHHTEYRFAVS